MKPRSPLSWGVALLIGVASLGITGPASAEPITDPSIEQQLVDPVPPTASAPADDSATTDEDDGDEVDEDLGDADLGDISEPAGEAGAGADGPDGDRGTDGANGGGDEAAPVAPVAITSIENEWEFTPEDAPSAIFGDGEPGAELFVAVDTLDWAPAENGVGPVSLTVEQTVADDGTWAAPLTSDDRPLTPGTYFVSVEQVAGEQVSNAEVYFFIYDEWGGELDPTIDNIESGAWYTGPMTMLSGSGEPGAELEIFTVRASPFSLDASTQNEYTATVDSSGAWHLALAQPVQSEFFIAYVSQHVDGALVGFEFTDAYFFEPVTITSVSEGDRIASDEAPSVITGTLDPVLASSVELGLGLSVSLNGNGSTFTYDPDAQPEVVVNTDGTWSADFGDAIAPGTYLATAGVVFSETDLEAQNEMELASTMFTVLGGASSSGDELARTGSSSLLPWILGAVVLVLIGVGALLLSRRTRPDDSGHADAASDLDAVDAPDTPDDPDAPRS